MVNNTTKKRKGAILLQNKVNPAKKIRLSENNDQDDSRIASGETKQSTSAESSAKPAPWKIKSTRVLQCHNMRKKRWNEEVKGNAVNNTSSTVSQPRVLRSSASYQKIENINDPCVVSLSTLIEETEKCRHCNKGPLELRNIVNNVKQGLCPVLSINCTYCKELNIIRTSATHRTGRRGPPTFDVNSRAGIGALHAGIGHSHYSGLLSITGLTPLCSKTYRKREREAGAAVEKVAKRSCRRHEEEEKRLSSCSEGRSDLANIGVSYDMGWRKRGCAQNSSSGVGSAVGLQTGKVLSYSTRNTFCCICREAKRLNKEPREHDCRHNHDGSSKSMEANVAVELFTDSTKRGVAYSTYVGDDDSTTECRLKAIIDYDIEKWSDVNHASRTLGSRLYAVKGKVKGLTPVVIACIQKYFTCCINQNKGNPELLKEALSAIVPHSFGDHCHCKDWCTYSKDPDNYKHSDLPGGKDLSGDDLRVCIEDALSPFLEDKAIRKLAPAASSQPNECLNGIIGSKAPKIRHYGDSESSDFRTAAGVAQYNEGYNYLSLTTQEMSLAPCSTTENYVRKMDKKRTGDKKRKFSKKFKRARRQHRKNKTRKTSTLEAREGVTYRSGVGLTDEIDNQTITCATINDLKVSLKEQEFESYVNLLDESIRTRSNELHSYEVEQNPRFVVIDLETTGLQRSSDIVQIACTTLAHNPRQLFTEYLIPNKSISSSASKVHGITVAYKNGKKVLVKDRTILDNAVDQRTGLSEFYNFVKHEQLSKQILLIAHNGHSFDFRVLFNSLSRHGLLDDFMALNVRLVDSLKVITEVSKLKESPLNSCSSKSVSGLYQFLFGEHFEAHDALADAQALSKILSTTKLSLKNELRENAIWPVLFSNEMKLVNEAKLRSCSLDGIQISGSMREKIGREGMDNAALKRIFDKGGVRGLLSVLALPKAYEELTVPAKKPRVTKNTKCLTAIVNYFRAKATPTQGS